MGAAARKEMHKSFRAWLDTTYEPDSIPSEEEWQTIIEEGNEVSIQAYEMGRLWWRKSVRLKVCKWRKSCLIHH